MAKTAHLVGALLALVMCLAATAVSAQRSVECQMVWTGASSNNSLLACLGNKGRIQSQWAFYLYPGFAALIFISTLIVLPIVFCCGCCKACATPEEVKDIGVARCYLWMWIVISVLMACGVCVLLVYGAVLLGQTANQIISDVENRTLDYFNETRMSITTLLTNYSASPPTPPTIDLNAFDSLNGNITYYAHMVRESYLKYFRIAEIVACCVGGVGIFLMLCMLVFAACRCSGCCPIAWSCVYFVFALVFALLAVLFTVSIYVMFAGCGEVNLQYKRAPGIFQWYLVPWCREEFNFRSVRAEVQAQEQRVSQSACSALLMFCDNDPVYPGTDKNHIFMCGNNITSAEQCKSLDDVVTVVLSTYVKPMLTNTLCANRTDMTQLEKCTLEDCASMCVDYQAPFLPAKTYATQIIQAVNFAANASTALSYVYPLLECNFIIDKVANTVESLQYDSSFTAKNYDVHSCSAIRTSSVMLGTGFFVGSLMYILGIYVMHRGAWVWAERKVQCDTSEKRLGASSTENVVAHNAQ
ncbi:hypothetical protein LPMP_190540 [Leishmania panamensis]|uniref:Uncharacterized protein n=1 Tax=Leishmania panamensis TaxID=5679 RepID=A0A088S753_LEIPA|nr:hypothetical protein LPMP_190540 [Leishmania panamensis]AIN97396.1 hypothetical protein LPMP_190540 [Leishmania panamensis]